MQLKLEWRDGRLRPVALEREPRPVPNPYVETLQACLNAAGHPCTVDGKFGRGTERAVRQFQQRHGLEETGRVDPETARRLGESTADLVGDGGGAAALAADDDALREWDDEEGGEDGTEEKSGKGKKKGKKKKKEKRKKDR
ncbi:MAG TPA: peptidoglycan-binding domain-containing protein [Planctomycetota bacterium]|nr:peptidoglycan-binding domain-containing protein [Planctomycetota bacterium]